MRKLSLISVFLLIVCVAFAQSTNFNEGKKALESNDLDGALSYFNKDLVDNPTSALTFYYRAWVYYINSEYAKALNDITAGLKYVSSKQNKLKGGFYEMRAKVYNQLDEPDKAMADYNLAIKTDAEDPDFYNGRAQLFFEKKMYANADKDYQSMLKLDETDADALTGLSRNLLAQGKHEEADKMLLKLKKLHPEYANAYYYSAINKFEQQKYNDAISESFLAFCLDDDDDSNRELFLRYAAKNYDFALSKLNIKTKEEPENYYWYFYKGLLLQNNEKYGDAIISYNRTLSLMEEPNFKVMEHRANCYSELGLQELAIKDFDYILSKDSTRSYVYAYRADAKRLLGKYKEALSDFTSAIELEPREGWFYYRRGWIQDEFLKNTNAGLADYNKAIEIDKEYAYTYLHRGKVYKQKLNDIQKANADFLTILKLDTVVTSGGNCRHYALFELGRINESIEWLRMIIDKFPTNGNYYDAACLYSLMNMQNEAIKCLTLAFENGYKDISHLFNDDDLNNIKNSPEFKSLITKWKIIIDDEIRKATPDLKISQTETNNISANREVVIPMVKQYGGTYMVACKINELPLHFIFDTGASDISISQTEVQFMLKNNYLTKSDIRGSQSYEDASGNISLGTKINLRKVEIGEMVLKNVEASVVHNTKAPLLFGQSALGKYAKILIDNQNNTITISNK